MSLYNLWFTVITFLQNVIYNASAEIQRVRSFKQIR